MGTTTDPILPDLGEVDVFESWVLSVDATDSEARLELDLVVLPGHPSYSPPRPGELHCYLGGTLRFVGADAVVLERSGLPAATSADGTVDLGHPEVWTIDAGHHQLSGDWGALDVWGGTVVLELDFPANHRVELLPGLPATGERPVPIGMNASSRFSEGCVVRIDDGRGASWIANVERGWVTSPDRILRTPNRDRFVCVAGGLPWYLDATQPGEATPLAGWRCEGVPLLRHGVLLLLGEPTVTCLDIDGVRWSTGALPPTYGGAGFVGADADSVTVELIDARTDEQTFARLRLTDGTAVRGPSTKPVD